MITGQIKNQIDQIWDTFWESAGITNPMTVLEQMTYLFFIKLLDDSQIQREVVDNTLGMAHASDDTFKYGLWHNPETNEDVDYEDLRWRRFKQFDPETMYRNMQRNVFLISNRSTAARIRPTRALWATPTSSSPRPAPWPKLSTASTPSR